MFCHVGTCFVLLYWKNLSNFELSVTLVELLDAEEFGADSETITYDESSTKAAVELDLTVCILTTIDYILHVYCPLLYFSEFVGRRRIQNHICSFFSYHQLCLQRND